ncbi:UDP-N-acetylmuramoyl-L-alanyl-D-glutamate--2,6-diaminopimelate ligase [Halalkalibacillus sediminis]|uniref:UDP-N-acetylmuramoyl-L-alanyl-D-glutamate--2,6-diaminopimelate ligase n=1 Tax=Halalkalibacillus sediminis TaxID=2018042 RepID=A0A2I0QW29_9BACI|nr:UDP-N-acetylmuramoyl-L-alanyl-D-glutamate--2,6-diaminopimelate ligase [Halalkalibacillus sediminis]PKR78535.1 UDP-N-acetylmuramoyl-L-alanyl-D-glutamate--2,6-diaminopimelate ligase [Halalkalibacillus sediminis]
MLLDQLIDQLKIYKTNSDLKGIEISSIEMDSREVSVGSLFVCLQGMTVDGHEFVDNAIEDGAAAILSEKPLDCSVPVIVVPSTIKSLAILADYFYGMPSQHMNVVGITGTNGKTTMTYLIDEIFRKYGHKTAIVGTIHMKIGDHQYPVRNTTPDSLFLHKHFHQMLEAGVHTVIMEVSSHALSMGRVYGIDFNSAIFTNLTQDHLDYHLNMNDYAYAKSLLFSQLGNEFQPKRKTAVINVDDPYADVMSRATSQEVVTYGLGKEAFIRADNIRLDSNQSKFDLILGEEIVPIEARLPGKFNVYNMLGAIALAYSYNIPVETVKKALEETNGVPGRFEAVNIGQPFTVIVDYAHTPDSLENVLQSIVELKKKRVYTVVGCGGDRDRTKRPKMADVAMKYSNFVYFTSDNPRNEDPKQILKDMTGHITGHDFHVIIERERAIQQAIQTASEGDIVLIAGKGHETYQEVKGERVHFDDREVAKEAIERFLKEQS